MNKLSKWDYRRQRDRLIHELRTQGHTYRGIAGILCISKTTVAAVLKQERIYAQILPWLVLEPTTNPELAAKRVAMLFGEEYLEQLTRACWDQCRQLPAMPAPVSKVVEQLRVRFNAHELYSIATIIASDIHHKQFQQRW